MRLSSTSMEIIERFAHAMFAKHATTDRRKDRAYDMLSRRFHAIAFVFVAVLLLIALANWAALEAIDVVRAYATAEASYSKAQKSAVIKLHAFGKSGDLSKYTEFKSLLNVALGGMRAREALERDVANFQDASRGFVQVGVDAQDTFGMNVAFLALRDWGPIKRAVSSWRQADLLLLELDRLGEQIRKTWEFEAPLSRLSDLYSRVDAVDEELTRHELAFGVNLREAAQKMRFAAFSFVLACAALLGCGGGYVTWKITRKSVRSERRALASEGRFKDFTEIASDWFCELDHNLCVAYMSERFIAALGVSATQIYGRPWQDVACPPWISIVPSSHFDIVAARKQFRGHVMRLNGPDGTDRCWSLSGQPVFDSAGRFNGYRATGTDISALARSNRALLTANELAEQATTAKSKFLANMSHELRTPLNAIIGFSEVMMGEAYGVLGDRRYVDYTKHIHEAGQHLLSLINDVLDISRVEAGKFQLREEKIAFVEIVRVCLSVCSGRAESVGVFLAVDVAMPSPVVAGDPVRLNQILINLVSNSIKFTPRGGLVSISARPIAGALAVEVTDTGIGMSPEDIEIALQPFGQVDHKLNRTLDGTGLGLPLTKTLVECHGGTLEINSRPGHGTTVRVTLPETRVEFPIARPAVGATPAVEAGRVKA